MRFFEKCGVYFIWLTIVSGADNHHPTTIPDEAMTAGVLDKTDVPPPPTPPLEPQRRRRLSGFIQPVL